jgi:hypothetical protein
MDELEEALSRRAFMSHYEILQRFKKVFGRDMNAQERQRFFSPDITVPPEEK